MHSEPIEVDGRALEAKLALGGAALLGLSLMASVVFHSDNRGERYVPGEARPDGRVTEGHFER